MTTPHQILRSFLQQLEGIDIPYMVGGSFASGAHGIPRQTNDLDIVLDLRRKDLDKFVSTFRDEYMLSTSDVEQSLASSDSFRSFQLLHYEALFKVDVFLLNEDAFSQSEMERRSRVELVPGILAWTKSAEDILLRKLLWFELGNPVSDRQWNDIVGVAQVQKGQLDQSYLTSWSEQLHVGDLLKSALSEAG